jgi:hypothetical protein
MPSITVPRLYQVGPGYLFRAPVGSALPGLSYTVTNKALTTNVATITTSVTHALIVGDVVTVALSPADSVFDGSYTITAITGTTFSYARVNANVTSGASGGSAARPGGVVAAGIFTDAWPAIWLPVGITREGTTFNYQVATANIEAAEYFDPLAIKTTGRTIGIQFQLMHLTNRSFLLGMNGGTSATIGGAAATLLTKVTPPAVGAEQRVMLGWESEDGTERKIYRQCIQSGSGDEQAAKAPNARALSLQFGVEQPTTGDPLEIYIAGDTRIAAA